MSKKAMRASGPVRALLTVLLLALPACTSPASTDTNVGPSASPSPLPEATTRPATPTPIPTIQASATATETPTPAPKPTLSDLKEDEIKTQVDKLAAWFLAQGKSSGLGVAVVVRDPQTGRLGTMLLNYGTTAKDNGQAVTSSTIYEIGSITKVFTGILLAQAVDAGDMQLDDPIQQYLPPGIHAPSFHDTPITLLDLATHRSSLPRDAETDDMPVLYNWLSALDLSRAPGSEYAYSNLGYAVLGDILARRAGTGFDTLEFQSVSGPLGLPDTREALSDEQAGRLAQAYTYDGSPVGYFPQAGAMSSAGYMHSTLDDMTRFLVANMEPDSTPLAGPIRMAQALQAERGDPGTGIGLGWEIDQVGTTSERLSKGGATLGFTSYISFLRDGNSGFVLLSNGMYANQLVPRMISIIGGK